MIVKDADLSFHGFSINAAKKSFVINRILKRFIASVERDIGIVTSTPKPSRRMEISLSKHCNSAILSMDHDSGYMSLYQDSNSANSSVERESISENVPNQYTSEPVYLSEDALLEKPESNLRPKNLDTKNKDDDETRNFCADSNDCTISENVSISPDSVLSTSVVSQKTTYSGFDSETSNTSIEIPCSSKIVIENIDNYIGDTSNISDTTSFVSPGNAQNDSCIQSEIVNSSCIPFSEEKTQKCERTECNTFSNNLSTNYESFSHCVDQYGENETYSAFSDITNICNSTKTNEKTKRLTLIFSKNNKENIYSVKRKFQSTSPVKDPTPEENDTNLSKNLTPEKKPIVVCVTKEGESKETNSLDNNETPEKELILKKELDLDEIVLHQEHFGNSPVSVPQKEKVVHLRKEIIGQIESIEQNPPSILTPRKKFENPIDPNVSPDLFENEEIAQDLEKEPQPLNYIAEEKYIVKKDQRILRRAHNSLKGVLPPHSVTVVRFSIDEMLNRLETNKTYFWTSDSVSEQVNTEKAANLNTSDESNVVGESKSLLVTGSEGCVNSDWPQILQERYHGLHHNRSKLSEEFEELCSKYGGRYIGAETQSTCTIFETNFVSPTKRKQPKQRWAVKSPGRRLSHLAKRRITFSSSNLQGGPSSSIFGSRARQILVDAKKLDLLNRRKSPRKSPRKNFRRSPRKTPSKSPRVKSRTPSSSAKKKLAMRFRELTGEIENTMPSTSFEKNAFLSKRKLFQSPDRDAKLSLFQPSTSGLSFENELKNPATKRTLFLSPSKRSPLKNSPLKRSPFKRLDLGADKKRKRTDFDDAPPSKLARSVSVDIRPSESEVATEFGRAKSDMNISVNKAQAGPSGKLSALHKKKLQWAVYEALHSQNITPSHAQFKVFASALARVTRRFLPNLASNAPKECGTTEKMLRIARFHVYAVIKGKSVEEIISEHLRYRARSVKPQGYVGLDDSNTEKKNSEPSCRENAAQGRTTTRASLDKKKLEQLSKPKIGTESRIDRIRKVINFGDDNR